MNNKINKQLIIGLVSLLILDIVWIKYVMGSKYEIMINNIQGEKMVVKPIYALFTYIIMCYGYYKFVHNTDLFTAFIFGIILYSVYDFTSLAVIKNWNLNTAILDILWGGILFGTSFYISKKV